jgi:carbamoylphosphate synthase small subunit
MSRFEPAFFVLEDGTRYTGHAYGARGRSLGEAVFTTGMTGYQETITDPSYAGQIVIMTAPHIGNTGVNDEDPESRRIWVEGFVVRDDLDELIFADSPTLHWGPLPFGSSTGASSSYPPGCRALAGM